MSTFVGPHLSTLLCFQHTGMYALVSKGLRQIAEGKDPLHGQNHQCGMGNMFDYHSTGYEDLDELQKTPQPLIFIMELFKVSSLQKGVLSSSDCFFFLPNLGNLKMGGPS